MIQTLQRAGFAVLIIAAIADSAFCGEPAAQEKPVVSQIPTLTPVAGPEVVRPTNASDPAREQALKVMLAMLPELRKKAAPFVRVAIPDPLELQRLLGLKDPPPDNDPPVSIPKPPAAPSKP